MLNYLPVSLLFLLLLHVPVARADSESDFMQLSASYYIIELYDELNYSDRRWQAGAGITLDYYPVDYLALRAGFYSLGNGDFNGVDVEGSELLVYYRKALFPQDYYVNLGAGIFDENWDGASVSGITLGLGLGLRIRNRFWLEFMYQVRDTDDYDSKIASPGEEINYAYLLSMTIGARF